MKLYMNRLNQKFFYHLMTISLLSFFLSILFLKMPFSVFVATWYPDLFFQYAFLEFRSIILGLALQVSILPFFGPVLSMMFSQVLMVAGSSLFLFCTNVSEYQLALVVLNMGVGAVCASALYVAHFIKDHALQYRVYLSALLTLIVSLNSHFFSNIEVISQWGPHYWIIMAQVISVGLIGCFIAAYQLSQNQLLKRSLLKNKSKPQDWMSFRFEGRQWLLFFVSNFILMIMLIFFHELYDQWVSDLPNTYFRLVNLFQNFPLLMAVSMTVLYAKKTQYLSMIESSVSELSFISFLAAIICFAGSSYYPFFSPLMFFALVTLYGFQFFIVTQQFIYLLNQKGTQSLVAVLCLSFALLTGNTVILRGLIKHTPQYLFGAFSLLLLIQTVMMMVSKDALQLYIEEEL